MNVPAEFVNGPQDAGYLYKLLHRVIGIVNDSRAQEQPLDVVALVELHREVYDFLHGKSGAWGIAGNPVDAVRAIVDAIVCKQNFQQRNAPAVRRETVADAARRRIAESARSAIAGGFAARACRIV